MTCRRSVSSREDIVYIKQTAPPGGFSLVLKKCAVDDSNCLNYEANCVDNVHAITSQPF